MGTSDLDVPVLIPLRPPIMEYCKANEDFLKAAFSYPSSLHFTKEYNLPNMIGVVHC